MDSIRVSEAPDPGSIPGEATNKNMKNPLRTRVFLFKNSSGSPLGSPPVFQSGFSHCRDHYFNLRYLSCCLFSLTSSALKCLLIKPEVFLSPVAK